jgi:hypothetical protein
MNALMEQLHGIHGMIAPVTLKRKLPLEYRRIEQGILETRRSKPRLQVPVHVGEIADSRLLFKIERFGQIKKCQISGSRHRFENSIVDGFPLTVINSERFKRIFRKLERPEFR